MSANKSGIILNEGEELVMEIEAELWASSSNIFARMLGSIRKFINLILGFKQQGFLVITDKRVIEIIKTTQCWIFNAGTNVKYVLPSSVKEVGYTKTGTCFGCFCQAYNLYYESFTQRTNVLLDVDDEISAQKIADAFYKAIKAQQ